MITRFLQYVHDVKAALVDHPNVSQLEAIVLNAFARDPRPRSGYMLMEELRYTSGAIYNALWKLERDGRLVSYWADGDWPRRRFYELPHTRSAKRLFLEPR